MNIAFYAPMKSPNHHQPSGDRLIARNTMAALELAGHKITLASSLRSWEGAGDKEAQNRIRQNAAQEADQLITQWLNETDETNEVKEKTARPELWFTYHCYHKSPDWLGPAVSKSLSIPYVLMETSHARTKPRNAPWQQGLEQTQHAIASADLLISINRADMEGVDRVRSATSIHHYVPPFIDINPGSETNLASTEQTSDDVENRLLAVAMMRHGDKLQSYEILAEAMSRLDTDSWHLDIVGDGAAKAEVLSLFKHLSNHQTDVQGDQPVKFHGELAPADVAERMKQADYLVWPGINEALGMVYLEAQACGLPVIAGKMAGTADLISHQQSGWLVANPDAGGMASAIDQACLLDKKERSSMRETAASYCHNRHSLSAAAQLLDDALQSIKRPVQVNT